MQQDFTKGAINAPAANSNISFTPQAKFKQPKKVTAAGSTIYGYMEYTANSQASSLVGLNELGLDGSFSNIVPLSVGPSKVTFSSTMSYLRNGQFHVIGQEIYYSTYLIGTWHLIYDLDGNLVEKIALSDDADIFRYSVYSPKDDTIYGYITYEYESDDLYWATAPGSDPTNLKIVGQAQANHTQCLTYNQVTDQIVGVTSSATGALVVTCDKFTGNQTAIAAVDYYSHYRTAIAYSPIDGGYIYGVCRSPENGGSSIELLDPDTFEVLESTPYADVVEWNNFMCQDLKAVDNGAPAVSSLLNSDFKNGALSGTLTYALPSATQAGNPILGNIYYDLYIDGELYKHGTAAAGSQLDITVSNLTEGLHKFAFQTSLSGKTSRQTNDTIYVGLDTPARPASVTLSETQISWEPVTTGLHNGYVNPAEITYNVYLNDELILSGTKGTNCTPQLPSGQTMTFYSASVEAVYAGKTSPRTSSNDLRYGDPFSLPVSFEPTDSEIDLFTIVDANNDGTKITSYYATIGDEDLNTFVYSYDADNDADDWLFLPPVTFTNSADIYCFSMNAFRVDDYDEKYEIALCSQPNPGSRVKTIKEEALMTDNVEAATFTDCYDTAYFQVPRSGAYYIGIHVTSDCDEYNIFFRDFSVYKPDNMSVKSPGIPTDISCEAAEEGELSATVTFTLPTQTVSGSKYADGKALQAVVNAYGCEEVTVSGTSGQEVTATVPTKQGTNTIYVRAKDGNTLGVPATAQVYTGIDIPGRVTNLTWDATDDNQTITLAWDPPTTGQTGGYINQTGINYYLWDYDANQAIALGTDVYTASFTLPADKQALKLYGVKTENAAGMASYLNVAKEVLGTPFTMPLTSSYTAGTNITPVTNYASGTNIYVGDPGKTTYLKNFKTTDGSKALYTYSSRAITDGRFTLPKIATTNSTRATLSMNVYGGSCDSFSVYARATGEPETLLGTYSTDDNLEEGPDAQLDIELPAQFQNKGWVEFSIHFNTLSKYQGFILYSYKLFDNVDYDFAINAIEGASNAKIGEEAKYTAHIFNNGCKANPFQGGTWTLKDENDQILANVTVDPTESSIDAQDEITYNISFTPTADYPSKATLTYTLEDGDMNSNNDSLTKEIIIGKGDIPVITDLHAEDISYDQVTLGWTKPSGGSICESFEDEPTLVYDSESDTIAGFKRIDRDGSKVYGPYGSIYASLPFAYQPQSFVVWSTDEMEQTFGAASNYCSFTGDQFTIAFCPSKNSNGTYPNADDWLISPQIAPGSSFSFMLKPITYQYGSETIEILYSTTTDSPEAFTLLDTISTSGEAAATPVWEEYKFTTPNDAKYFAIHYVSKDIFGIMIDDITYTPDGSFASLSGYNIYRDGDLIESNTPCASDTYTDATISESTNYSYTVTPVLSDGTLGLDSNTLKIQTTTVGTLTSGAKAIYSNGHQIIVAGYEGSSIQIIAPDGKTIARSARAAARTAYTVVPGIYIIKAGNDTIKLTVN